MKEDLIYYPPALTLIKTLCDLQYSPIHIGTYSDERQMHELETRGACFIKAPSCHIEDSLPYKLISQRYFRRFVTGTLKEARISGSDLVWILNAETLVLLDKVVENYKTVVQFYEFTVPRFNWKYALLYPFFDIKKVLHKAYKIVHCEYDRAQLSKWIYQLERMPYVLPNKPYEEDVDAMPDDIRGILDDLRGKTSNKCVLLYQGVIQPSDRRLEEFCEAIPELPDRYVLVIMGRKSQYAEYLRKKYPIERIIFVPFVRPPYHLLVTRMATIGILSYLPGRPTWQVVVNTVYCAPNKVFEYSKYSKPMIANDIPGLRYTFKQYGCGETVDYPLTAGKIVDAIFRIENSYEEYASNARRYYDDIQIPSIVRQIIEEQ